MDEFKTVINSLLKSNYLDKWILELKNNEVLFSPKKNIKPCIKSGDVYRSDYWDGLRLIIGYCQKKEIANEEVDEFIISLLNESIEVYNADKEEDPYKRLNSSFEILVSLLDIVISKPKFINCIDFACLIKIYLSSPFSRNYPLAYELQTAKEILRKADAKKVFEAYKVIIESKSEEHFYEDYLVIDELIAKNPIDYYTFAKKHIIEESSGKRFFDLGAFFEYERPRARASDYDYFQWLKIASLNIDSSVLAEDIRSFIKTDNRLIKKVALCLININYKRLGNIFIENLDSFFNDEEYYADLRCLLDNNKGDVFTEKNKTPLLDALTNATFGLKEGKMLSALKNHLSFIYSVNGYSVPYLEETQRDLDFVLNFNKSVYSVQVNKKEDVKDVKSSIVAKNIEGVAKRYNELSNGSSYFDSVLHQAFREYLLENYHDTFFDCLKYFDDGFVASVISYYSFDKKDEKQVLLSVVETAISLIWDDKRFLGCLSQLLYGIQKLSETTDYLIIKKLIDSIDYKWIGLEEYSEYKDVIMACINENLHTYFEILATTSQAANDLSRLKEAIEYHKGNNDCSKLKSILAFIYPRVLYLDKSYARSLRDYVFNNICDGKNLSYPLLAISGGVNDAVLEEMAERDDLKAFLAIGGVGSDDEETALSFFAQHYFRAFLFENKYKEIIKIQFDNRQFSIILDCIRDTNYWWKEKAIEGESIERYREYFGMFLDMLKRYPLDTSQIDQLIRETANTIVLSNNFDDIAWEVLVLLFEGFHDFFSDDCVELIKKYKKIKAKEITTILDAYFSSYEPYHTYEETMIETFNLIAKEKAYGDKPKKWKVALVKKNSSLKSKLLEP